MMPPQAAPGVIPPSLQAAMPPPQQAAGGAAQLQAQFQQVVTGAKSLIQALSQSPQVDQPKLQMAVSKLMEGMQLIADAVKGGGQPGAAPGGGTPPPGMPAA